MRKLPSIMLLAMAMAMAIAMTGTAHAGPRAEVGRYAKAYTGGEGLEVWVMRYGPVSAQEALVQVNGIDHPWDHRIFRSKVVPQQNGAKYVITAEGRQHDLLTVSSDGGIEVMVPGMPRRIPLRYDLEVSRKGNTQHFLTDFEEQR